MHGHIKFMVSCITYNPSVTYLVRMDFNIGWGIVLNIVRPIQRIPMPLKVKYQGSLYTHDQGLREKWFRISCKHGHKKSENLFQKPWSYDII